jgi:dihydroorotase
MRIHIRGGRVIDPANDMDQTGDVFIVDGQIVAVCSYPDAFQADLIIDAVDQVVCPGLVDLRVRLREPGHEHKGTIASETNAAAAGGITTLCCPPDTDPVVDTPAVVELIRHRAEQIGKCRVVTLGALTQDLNGQQLSEMYALKEVGCVGVSNALWPVSNTQVMRRAMEYAASLGMTVFLHPEDEWLSNHGCAHEGIISARLGLEGVPECAETIAVGRDLMLVEQTGVQAHFCQLSTDRAVKMLARAQFDGLPVTADVTAHHLHLTEMDIGYFNSNCHVRPPLRTQRDREGLIQGLSGGSVSAVCSDHQPHDVDAKLAPFPETEPGISGVETLLPLTLRLMHDGGLTLKDVVAKLTCNPAKILGLESGTLGVGRRADICIFDPERYWALSEGRLLSHGQNTPFFGWDLQGKVTHTLLDGKVVYQSGDIN